MAQIYVATEDVLSESVALRLIDEVGDLLEVRYCFGRQGNGYLQENLSKFCSIAKREPVFLLTDLDKKKCASLLISEWLGTTSCPKKLLFRVANREIESWLLADHVAVKSLLGNKVGKLPENPDNLSDPKSALLGYAKKAPRKIRDELVAESGALATQGLGYNVRLSNFIRNTWSPERASLLSQSLARARQRLRELAASI